MGPTQIFPMTAKDEVAPVRAIKETGGGGEVEVYLQSCLIWKLDGSGQRHASTALLS
jgi:hypothetical protein